MSHKAKRDGPKEGRHAHDSKSGHTVCLYAPLYEYGNLWVAEDEDDNDKFIIVSTGNLSDYYVYI